MESRLHKQEKAYSAVQRALWNGELRQPNKCSDCGIKCEPIAHHPDYDKPKKVVWLCKKCHKKVHKQEAKEDRQRRKNLLIAYLRRNIAS